MTEYEIRVLTDGCRCARRARRGLGSARDGLIRAAAHAVRRVGFVIPRAPQPRGCTVAVLLRLPGRRAGRRTAAHGRAQRVLGRLRGPADSHAEFAYPLLAADAAPSALVALVEAASVLAPGIPMRWYRVREDSPVLASLSALEPRLRVLRPVSSRGSLVRTTGPRGDFEATMHDARQLRRNLRKAANRAARDHSVAFHSSAARRRRARLLKRFLHVENSGWKGTTGTAIARSPQRVAFYEALTRRLAQTGLAGVAHGGVRQRARRLSSRSAFRGRGGSAEELAVR